MNNNYTDSTIGFNDEQDFSVSNHNASVNPQRIMLPLPPQGEGDIRMEMDIYARFMRHLRHVPNSRMEIKILSAMQFTADMMDLSDALVAKILVDCGLRAPRRAFPVSFLDFADKSVARSYWDAGSPPVSVIKLRDHWDKIGEERFGVRQDQYALYPEGGYVSA
ncbi:MAG: hypothetical protein H6867_06905 [Rhodospirillales bacterium]|nr:hypothetical protein [Rhodospirillales bacterium]MCB9995279.1 hypothetical protein [Rhodospirillales bacterium]